MRSGRDPPGIRLDEADPCKPPFELPYSIQVLHGAFRRARLSVSYDGSGVCDRDYPRAVHVVHGKTVPECLYEALEFVV